MGVCGAWICARLRRWLVASLSFLSFQEGSLLSLRTVGGWVGLGGQGDGAGHGGYMLAAVSYSFQASSIRVYSSKILDFTFTGGVGGGKWNIG